MEFERAQMNKALYIVQSWTSNGLVKPHDRLFKFLEAIDGPFKA